jgi:four helix bundle protein
VASIKTFEELEVWQQARLLVREIYDATKKTIFSRDFPLRDQMRRAATSVLSNIAEGFERSGNREFSHYLYIAKGSAGELRAQLYIALDQGYLEKPAFEKLHAQCMAVSRQLSGLFKYLARATATRPAKT